MLDALCRRYFSCRRDVSQHVTHIAQARAGFSSNGTKPNITMSSRAPVAQLKQARPSKEGRRVKLSKALITTLNQHLTAILRRWTNVRALTYNVIQVTEML